MAFTPLAVITEALEMSHTTLDQIGWSDVIGQEKCLRWLNKAKDKFWSWVVTAVGEDFGWQQWTTPSVAGQSEYPTLEVASDRAGTKKIEAVYVAYNNSTYENTGKLQYTKCALVTRTSLEREWEWYEANQPTDRPLYIIADNSIFIAPVPTIAISTGIKLTGIQKIPDYSETTQEAEMVITSEYSYILVQGLLPYIYRFQGKINEANAETAEYERLETKALYDLGDRITWPMYSKYPDEQYRGIFNPFWQPEWLI